MINTIILSNQYPQKSLNLFLFFFYFRDSKHRKLSMLKVSPSMITLEMSDDSTISVRLIKLNFWRNWIKYICTALGWCPFTMYTCTLTWSLSVDSCSSVMRFCVSSLRSVSSLASLSALCRASWSLWNIWKRWNREKKYREMNYRGQRLRKSEIKYRN